MNEKRNTDREIYHTPFNSIHDDSIHVTENGSIGINVAGRVIVMPLRDWHALAMRSETAPTFERADAYKEGYYAGIDDSIRAVSERLVGGMKSKHFRAVEEGVTQSIAALNALKGKPSAMRTETRTPEAPEYLRHLAEAVRNCDALPARERAMAATVILSFATPHELRTLGTAMLVASDKTLRWHAEKLASRLGCSGPYTMGDAMPRESANE